uniref:Uncharacterized protein n=1 Tax=Anguilla anguilla TaxID=7936 RepID=A0A0E9W2P6_ANGAN
MIGGDYKVVSHQRMCSFTLRVCHLEYAVSFTMLI